MCVKGRAVCPAFFSWDWQPGSGGDVHIVIAATGLIPKLAPVAPLAQG